MDDKLKNMDTPGQQAGEYEAPTSDDVKQEVCELNSLQAGGSGDPD